MFCGKICVLFLVALPAIIAETDYCSSSLCGGQSHIACNNKGNFAAICVKPELITITPELKQQILDQHNSLRNKIAQGYKGFPPAERMATMVWDEELAKLAVLNVKQCQMKHDSCHNTNNFPFSGQNLASNFWSGTGFSVSEITTGQIQRWFDEIEVCPKGVIQKYQSSKGKAYGHFTAMVRDKSTHVGCAIIRYKNGDYDAQLMACNYADTNMLGEKIYAAGKTASKCASGSHQKYKGLCSIQEKY